MYDDIESMRLRLEAVLKDLARQEAADMHFDAKLLTEMRYLATYFREQGYNVQVSREGYSLTVRIAKERQ
jgi:hypothetical protein